MIANIESVYSDAFNCYGRVFTLPDGGWDQLVSAGIPCPSEGIAYEPSYEPAETPELIGFLKRQIFGDLDIQIGYVSGHNRKLEGLEWHQGSEVQLPLDPIILLLAKRSELRWDEAGLPHLHSDRVRAFYVPARTAVEMTAETLHLAPVSCDERGYRSGCVLLRGTNTARPAAFGEDPLQTAKNKWMISHPDASDPAPVRTIEGPNIEIPMSVAVHCVKEEGHETT